MDAASLSKLNVSQLKAKCKDLKLAGYSKLAKVALIEKLVTSTSGASGEVPGAAGPAAIIRVSESKLTQAIAHQIVAAASRRAYIQGEPPNPVASLSTAQTGASRHAGANTESQKEMQPALAPNTLEAQKKSAKKRSKKDDGKNAQDASQPQSTNDPVQQSNPPSAPPSGPPSTAPKPLLSASQGASRGTFQVPLLPARLTQASAVSNASNTPTGAPPTLTAPVSVPEEPIPSSTARAIPNASTSISHSTISSNEIAVKPPKPPSTKSTVTETEKI
ncbi:hypothetical protein FRC07_006825, partial [Ceratobasidium sp. 392]